MLNSVASPPILQFGTSRFLQAHVDLFVSEAMASGDALGGIAVVQTTANPQSAKRVHALNRGEPYPVRIRGLMGGVQVDETRSGGAIRMALQAQTDWPRVLQLAVDAQVIVSNTGDKGYLLDPADDATLLEPGARLPQSFPAKLLVLLHARWRQRPKAALTLLPCELIARNGDTLREQLVALATEWAAPSEYVAWLREHCVWANSLVDRIVSEALDPIGAIAEPYALWAVERQPRLVMPCEHPSIVLTDELVVYEQLKLYLLNLGHTFLAERWLQTRRAADETVVQILADATVSNELEALWADEVLPVFDALGRRDAARDYLDVLRERLRNPFLAHRIADIADNREQKIQRRFGPVVKLAEQHGLRIPQTRLRAGLAPLG